MNAPCGWIFGWFVVLTLKETEAAAPAPAHTTAPAAATQAANDSHPVAGTVSPWSAYQQDRDRDYWDRQDWDQQDRDQQDRDRQDRDRQDRDRQDRDRQDRDRQDRDRQDRDRQDRDRQDRDRQDRDRQDRDRQDRTYPGRSRNGTEPPAQHGVTCYTCVNVSDNLVCNRYAIDRPCPEPAVFCHTLHIMDSRGDSVIVNKKCADHTECSTERVGCMQIDSQKVCVSCCDEMYCNVSAPTNHSTALFSDSRARMIKQLQARTNIHAAADRFAILHPVCLLLMISFPHAVRVHFTES